MNRQRLDGPEDGIGDFRFAANLKWLFANLPLERRFAAASEHGFRAVEYPNPYEYPIDAFDRMLGDEGLELALINTPPLVVSDRPVTGIACDPSLRAEFRSGVELGLEYAAGLGAGLLHVVAGPVPAGVSTERAWAEYLLNISWAAEAAHSTNVTLLIEPQNQRSSPGFALSTQARARTVIEAVGSKQLRLLFDVFHVQVQEGDVTEKLREFAPLIGHVQIADAPARTEPGTGELAWSHLFRQLVQLDYSGWVGCEYSAISPDGEHIEWLKRFGANDDA